MYIRVGVNNCAFYMREFIYILYACMKGSMNVFEKCVCILCVCMRRFMGMFKRCVFVHAYKSLRVIFNECLREIV